MQEEERKRRRIRGLIMNVINSMHVSSSFFSHIRMNHLPEEIILIIFNFIQKGKDRYQFTLTSRYIWQCILKNITVRQVDLSPKTNLLKLKLARSNILSSAIAPQKIENIFQICESLQEFVVKDNVITATFIQNLLRSAADSNRQITVIVPSTSLSLWKREKEQLQIASKTISIVSEYGDDDEVSGEEPEDRGLLSDLFCAQNYRKCQVVPLPEESILENLEGIITELGNTFINRIVTFETAKILVTSIDIFSHIEGADDCAYSKKWLKKDVFARINNKNNMNNDFYEVSIIVHGCIELLAIGGIVAFNGDHAETFLGSSVKPLTKFNLADVDSVTERILHEEDRAQTVRNRLLRQYYKRDSLLDGSFHMKAAVDFGFFPLNPVDVERHPSGNILPLIIRSFHVEMFC